MRLPEGLPDRFEGPSAWVGSDLAETPEQWKSNWSDAECAELRETARRFLDEGGDIARLRKEQFPLPTLAPRLAALSRTLLQGIGFAVISGLPAHAMTRAETAAIFCGIGAHLGAARSQNAAGHILGHVRDLGRDPNDPTARIYQTSARQSFHTDSADVVGLLCLNEAKSGGDSLLVSVETIYNRMKAQAPRLLACLFDPLSTDRRGEVARGQKPFMSIPPLSWHAGRLSVFYQRQYIDSARRFEDAFRLTPDHVAALDMFDALADDPALHLRMRLRPGDMQFVYNHGQLHDRTGFADWAEPERCRHLLRLWLAMPGDRDLPPVFAERYGGLTIGDRGGIIPDNGTLIAPLTTAGENS